MIAPVAAAATFGSAATAHADQTPAAHGVEAPIGAIPWPQVGPGWLLAMWSPVTGGHPGDQPTPGEPTYATASTTLYLVDPAGGRYTITTFPPPGDKAAPELADWSGDGSRALFYTRSSGQTVIEVDLHTGTQTTFTVNGQVTPRYTRPNGKAVMLVGTHTLERVDLAGNHQLTYPVGKDTRGYVYTPDGTQLVLGTDSGLALMGNDGTAGRELPVPGQTGCTQTRFWDTGSTIVVASCRSANYQSQLWLVPIDGGTPTALTAPNNGQVGPDYGDLDAWQLPAGTFVQAAGACGVIFLGPPVNGGGVIRALAYSRQE